MPIKNFIKKMISIDSKNSQHKSATSISDDESYPDFCIQASTDLNIFSNFRKNIIYKQILEHVSYELGKAYLEEISIVNPDLLTNIELFKLNDKFGNPEVFDYPGIGKISPSTLRYLKVYGDLITQFKQIDELKICEIGVGYGGQCRIINGGSKASEYTLVDIKPALMLTQRYLDNYVMNSLLNYKTMKELEIQNYDLLISNYAFTELKRDIQNEYLEKLILNSKMGYITYNEISPMYFKSYTRKELLKIIPNSRIIQEKPLTHKNNCIIIWGN